MRTIRMTLARWAATRRSNQMVSLNLIYKTEENGGEDASMEINEAINK